jgi:HEPN domain-containing protein
MDVQEQIAYWTTGSQEDFDAAGSLLEKGHFRHCLFFAHLAIEKLLKALVVHRTKKEPAKIHNLIRLAKLAQLQLDKDREDLLREFGQYQLEGRYPDSQQLQLSDRYVQQELNRTQEILEWLRQQL